MTLSIDTTQARRATVSLEWAGIRHEKVSDHSTLRAQVVLPLIDELLLEHQRSVTEITAIRVAVGPGSYTGIRVGLAVANMLGRLLRIPVNGKTPPVIPEYQ